MLTWDGFKSELFREANSIIESERFPRYVKKVFGSHIIWDETGDRQAVHSSWVTDAFKCVFSAYCSLLSGTRAIYAGSVYTYAENQFSPFERGLLLDFLFMNLRVAENACQMNDITKIYDNNILFDPLKKACDEHGFLSRQIESKKPPYKKRKELPAIEVYRADLPLLEFYYGNNRSFPWQRRGQTSDIRKYAFHILRQPFECNASISKYEVERLKLLDWYFREKYWGVNLSVLLSQYDPDLFQGNDPPAKYRRLWRDFTDLSKNTDSDKDKTPPLLKRIMRIPYPAYRISFMQTMLRWYTNEDDSDIKENLCKKNVLDIVEQICNLPPEKRSEQDDPDNKLADLTIEAMTALMKQAFVVSVLFGIIAYSHQGELPSDWKCKIEDHDFWVAYRNAIFNSIRREIEVSHAGSLSKQKSWDSQLPLLLTLTNDHSDQLLDTLALGRTERVTNVNAKAYCTIQKFCYEIGMTENSLITKNIFDMF